MAIQSFKNAETKKFFLSGKVSKGAGWKDVQRVAARKLDMLQAAAALGDLKAPPGNRLEALKGDLAGYHSIRINDQWRVVFRWTPSGAEEVHICDYHK